MSVTLEVHTANRVHVLEMQSVGKARAGKERYSRTVRKKLEKLRSQGVLIKSAYLTIPSKINNQSPADESAENTTT